MTRSSQIDGIRIVFGRRRKQGILRSRIVFAGMLMMVVMRVNTIMSVTMQMQMGPQSMIIRFSHTATRVRMRQALPEHEKRNQQE